MFDEHYATGGCIKCGADLPMPEKPWVDFGPSPCPACGVMHKYFWDSAYDGEDPVLMVELLRTQK